LIDEKPMTMEAQPAAPVTRACAGAADTLVRSASYVPGLDALRFFAASIVTVYHLAFWAWAYPQGQVAQASRGVADFPEWDQLTSGGWAGVQIFFVISGFVIATSSERSTALRFLQSRFVRLVPGVWVCATITLLAWHFIGVDTTYSHLYAYLRSVAFMPTPPWIDSVYWTLAVEIAFYTIIFLLLAMQRFEWLRPIACLLGLGSSSFWIVFTVFGTQGDTGLASVLHFVQWSRLGELTLIKHGVFFAMGVLLWLRLIKKAPDTLPWIALFALGGCLQIAGETVFKFEKTGLAYSPLLPCAMWLGSVAWIWLATTHNDWICRAPAWLLQTLRRLGLMTYPLYLLHNVTGGALMGSLAHNGLPAAAALWLAIAAVMALAWWVSRTPEPALQKLAKRCFTSMSRADNARARPAPYR
jgi:peptidoglycan/LPS O-acetylase OafA/YrhL